jgi:isoleucyl-tRNA synthetase
VGGDYKSTLNLPSTDFPMRANLSEREPDQVAEWDDEEIYDRMIARREEEGAERFVFHDGPPYANGHLHHGHILNKSLKDFVVKYQTMAGKLCEFIPGWDCHGLPIEHEVAEQLGDKKEEMSQAEIRRACREYADEFVGIQRDEIKRILAFADWENPYRTMSYDYEAAIIRMLGEFFDSDLVYRGLKPVHWDWDSKTALAEAEVEYQSLRTEHVYVKFPIDRLPDELGEAVGDRPAHVLIWTTTPWTLPANLAIALNPSLNYQIVEVDGEALILAEGLRDRVFDDCDIDDFEVLGDFEGRELVGELGERTGYAANHPWIDRHSVLLPAPYVTLEQGTGCVHTAPGHGQEDFALAQEHGLDVLCPVNEEGKYSESFELEVKDGEVKDFEGMHVLTANKHISWALDRMGALLNEPGERVEIERYPFGWRSKKPVIFRATTQWFVAMEPETAGHPQALHLREEALEAIDDVEWVPDWGRDRIEGMVESRPDWCLSRQRIWGVPITVAFCTDCDEALVRKDIADRVADLAAEHGADVWFEREVDELLPDGLSCPNCGGDSFEKETDILDVWFDSGVSWHAVVEERMGVDDQPVDLYLEGSDQHRGWFQSSLMTGVVTRGRAPYKTCLTHGFVTDEQGHKYSKSSKNFEPPEEMLEEFGAEILRLWVASVDYSGDVALSGEIVDRTADAYRKIRNTFRFMLGNLEGFDPDTDQVDYEELEPIDQYIVHRASEVLDRIERAYEEYEFHAVYHALVEFATVDLSNLYMDVTKDRMYCHGPDSPGRKAGQTAYWQVLNALVRAAAPILSFTAEEVWSHLPQPSDAPDSVFLSDFPELPDAWRNEAHASRWSRLLKVRKVVQKALEQQRQRDDDDSIGSSQQADLTLVAEGSTYELLSECADQLVGLFIVSDVDLQEGRVEGEDPVEVTVEVADREKCPRCWNYWVDPESDDEVCGRCRSIMDEM